MPVRANAMLFGTLVHETIEDIHRAALRHEEQTITEENVSRWFDSNYISLTKTEHTYLAGPQREAALKQVLRYVDRQHGDWSAIQQAEVDVSLVKPDYIIEGKVDLIRGEGDTVEIVDFKAERKPDMEKMRDRLERYRRQLHIYAHLVEERTGRKVSKMHLYYWYCCTSLRMPDTMSSPQRTTLCLQTIIPALPEEIAKSFHADTYCFDSKPEKECFMQYITSGKVAEVYFTGMFTSNQGDLSVHYYDPESGRIRQYYPDFLAKMTDGSYQLIEVKGDNKIDDAVVKAKQAAAEEMAVASGVKYLMYAGSRITSSHILDDIPMEIQQDTLPLGS